MTSPPDVQNVPDVWALLEYLRAYFSENTEQYRAIDAALSQRDRFVLVPKELTQDICTALAQAYLFDPNDAFVDKMVFVWAAGVAAAPKPEEKT